MVGVSTPAGLPVLPRPGPRRVDALFVTGGRDTPIGDMLYTVTGGEPMPTYNRDRGRLAWGQHRTQGGEWDYIREIPLRTRQRLTSAGYMAYRAMAPDEFGELIRDHVPGMDGAADTDCHHWYVRHALLALAERRRAHHYNRHLVLARKGGHRSYYERRVALVQALGYGSLWEYRLAMGWE